MILVNITYIIVHLVVLHEFRFKRVPTVTFVMSVHKSERNNSAPTAQIFIKFDTSGFIENLWRKLDLYEHMSMTGTLQEDLCSFISR